MRKCLLVVALLIVSKTNLLLAQDLFKSPDTVCMLQPVQLTSNVPNALTHYWGFCSGYAFNAPVGTNMGKTFGLDGASTIEIEKDGDNYYGFVINRGISNSFVRLEFGSSLDNTPKVTNYGSMNDVMPLTPNALHIVKDVAKGNWHVFIVGGTDPGNSNLARLDFGKTLANTPNVVNFGNINNVLDRPYGLFIQKEGDKWYGLTLNKTQNSLVRIEFDTLLSLTPKLYDLGSMPGLSSPNDFAPLLHNGLWHLFVTNESTGELSRIDLGSSIATAAPGSATIIGNFIDGLKNPTGISIIRDCDSFHIFITNRQSLDFVRLDVTDILGGISAFTLNNYGAVTGSLTSPSGLSRAIRDHDNIFMFTTNEVDSTLSKIKFQQCSNASIQSSTTMKPPVYKYDTAGVYNLYYMVDEGLPTMKVQCKLIYVQAIPPLVMSNDTAICQGDTVSLRVLSINAINKTWSPAYNITNTTEDNVRVWPRYSTAYRILLPFSSGCVVDTAIRIHVTKVLADAGPDRTLHDGASTLLGGPNTSLGINYSYTWTPNRYISNDIAMNPIVNPPHDYTYYLEVKDTSGCKNVDTVVVRVDCNDINLPNAFKPEGSNYQSRFGLANSQIIKLAYFRIYSRWGQEVFSTTDPTKEWDGKINGEYAPVGVYVYQVDGFCSSGKRVTKEGNVTVVR